MTIPLTASLRKFSLPLRILAAILGGWAFSWSFVACSTTVLVGLGMPFHDAETASLMLGLLAFLTVFLWAFATRSALRVATALPVGALLFHVVALLLQRQILSWGL
ncbi:iron uptake protein [Uliginosibacterium sp. 31-16]|uniref:iron uptake protein n=1 Tax=Uliginosibacterium sp. 31-16 TaxID=3068315 RepID=UPI00273F24B2|nr:iron uptake protein [Uliginosibacterium sp. 31-16]MDP5239274.1 iron uptake protein [Uliginosibacterium sp. 31-16]